MNILKNWANEIIAYPLPDGLPANYLESVKDEMRKHVAEGGKVTDKRSENIFLILCRIVDTFNGKKIDWDKTAEDYLKERENND